jgi:soluble lytic murein transglycosylase-like protein
MVKSIIDVDVNSTDFQKFAEMFKVYQEQLAQTKDLWGQSNAAIQETATGAEGLTKAVQDTMAASETLGPVFAEIAASVAAVAASTALMEESMRAVEPAATRASSVFGTIAGHSTTIASGLLGATTSLAKWAVFSAGAGLLGAGAGLFGLDMLANTVSGQRKASQGLGITTGEQQAFDVNFGSRLVGSDFLAGVQGAKSDLSQQWMFQQLGIPLSQVQNQDTAQLGIDVIGKARSLWQSAGTAGHNQQYMQSHGLSGFMDYSTWQRIGQMTPDQLTQYQNQYQTDQGTMGASDKTQTAWQDFSVQMKRVGDQMEAVFVTGLTPLIPQLTNLSKAVEAALAGFLGNPNMQSWINDFAAGIQELGTYLGSKQFQADVVTLATDIGDLGVEVGNALKYFGLIPGAQQAVPGGPAAAGASVPGLPSIYKSGMDWSAPWKAGYGMDFGPVGKKYGLTAAEFKAVGMQESRLNPHGPDSPAGAQGMFQQTPAFQQQWGVSNPYDPSQEANAFGMAMQSYLKKYHGNIAQALAAYNAGPGTVDAQIKAGGANWYSTRTSGQSSANFQQERGYVAQVGKGMGITVKVMNQTGSQVAILANAARQ